MDKKLFGASTTMTPDIYKEFYRLYYRERLKVFSIIAALAGVILIAGGIYLNRKGFGYVWSLIAVWIGAVLIIYPRVAYRKPYKKSKDHKQTTHFAFYEDFVAEKTNSKGADYKYAELEQVIETDKYIMIFHDMNSISIVDKKNVKGNIEELSEFLKVRTAYRRIKK